MQISYEKQIKNIQKEKSELFQKIEEISAEKNNLALTLTHERKENERLKEKISKKTFKFNELRIKFQNIEEFYAADVSLTLLDGMIRKLEDNETIKENAVNLKKDIEKIRKKKANFKKQITQ